MSLIYRNRLYLVPFLLLIATRIGIEIFVNLTPLRFAWIPSFIWYWALIYFSFVWLSKKKLVRPIENLLCFKPLPDFKWLIFCLVIPAILPLGIFIHVSNIPKIFIFYILIFAFINPWFEELFWRHCLSFLSRKKWVTILFSAGSFSFSHYFLWQYWFTTPEVMMPTIISTFVMGILWMLFLMREQTYIYVVISHIFVDILNLSVAIYYSIDIWNTSQ